MRRRKLHDAVDAVTATYNRGRDFQNRGDYAAAVRLYRRAAKAGDDSALLELARAELYGLGTRRNTKSAIRRLERVAVSKVTYWPPHWMQSDAMLVLADIFMTGWPVKRDYNKGRRWVRRAAKLGSARAKAMLGR